MKFKVNEYKNMFDEIPIPFCVIEVIKKDNQNVSYFIKYTNKAFDDYIGMSKGRVLNQNYFNTLHNKNTLWLDKCKKVAFSESKINLNFEIEMFMKHFIVQCYQIEKGICGNIISDITKEKQEAEEYKNKVVLYETCDEVGIFKMNIDEDLTLSFASDSFYILHGYTKETMKEENSDKYRRCIFKEDFETMKLAIEEKVNKKEEELKCSIRVITKKGDMKHIKINAVIIREKNKYMIQGSAVELTSFY